MILKLFHKNYCKDDSQKWDSQNDTNKNVTQKKTYINDSQKWFTKMIHKNDLQKWFTIKIHKNDSQKWFTNMIYKND